MLKKLILAFTAFLITTTVFSQTTKRFIDTGSVKNQFDYLIDESNKYQDYKVVKYNWLVKLKSNVSDSLSASKKEIISNYNSIQAQKKTIDSLMAAVNTSTNQITSLNTQIESISLFGIQFKKDTFKTIFFVIIGILAILLLFFITKYKHGFSIIKETKLSLKELEDEYENHRKRALEREQKVMRKLQDELNKNKKD
ncbi:hypothetical protein ACFQZW_10435 [Lutibacter aestuarii]|uniref:tRNA (Guanine-N1)-methyltransferase n=1 Tax=Lutibacter aestuarii TaxID=861111 RepID=A0ABW2Z6S5_9FLAO|nr:hypothetical protein [uncultured Lutibacter sp.]